MTIVGRTATVVICVGLISSITRGLTRTVVAGRIVRGAPDGLTVTGMEGRISVGMCLTENASRPALNDLLGSLLRSSRGRNSGLDVRLCRENFLSVRHSLIKVVVEAEGSAFRLVELKAVKVELCENIAGLCSRHELNVLIFTAAIRTGYGNYYLFHFLILLAKLIRAGFHLMDSITVSFIYTTLRHVASAKKARDLFAPSPS